jgi:hypothetical protein
MSRIWRYVLAVDTGMAPCIQDGKLTLTCCKPFIRKYAKDGDWVVGFVPKGLKRGHVAWIGKIAERIPLAEYERRFRNRKDAIYRLRKGELVSLLDDYHTNPGDRERDLRGKNALLFRPFWYWGGDGLPAPPDIADLAHYYVGQSAKNSSPEKIARLEQWAREVASPGKHGEPRTPGDRERTSVKRGSCRRNPCAPKRKSL